MQLTKLCSPAMLYLAIATISIIAGFMQRVAVPSLIIKMIFVGAWTWFLNYLCSKGHSGISWFLVLLPFILMIVIIAVAMECIKHSHQQQQQHSNKQQQHEGLH